MTGVRTNVRSPVIMRRPFGRRCPGPYGRRGTCTPDFVPGRTGGNSTNYPRVSVGLIPEAIEGLSGERVRHD